MPIFAIMRPIGPTKVVFAKARPYEGLGDSCAATAADHSSKTRDAVLAMPLPLDAGVPLQLPMFFPIVTEKGFGHCIPSAPFAPRHCGMPNEPFPRSNQTASPDAPSLAGAAAAPAATAPTSAVINTNSGSMNRNRNSRSSSSNTAAGATATAALTTTSAAAASTAAIAPQAATPSTARAATPSTAST